MLTPPVPLRQVRSEKADLPVLVTGASGFIGSHLARHLARSGHRVVGTARPGSQPWRLRELPANLEIAPLDLQNPDAVSRLFDRYRFRAVYHLAARGVQVEDNDPGALAAVNTVGTLLLARHALQHGVARFVYCGSGLEYRNSNYGVGESAVCASPNLYGATKAAGWLLLDCLRRTEGLALTTVRPFTVFGPDESPRKLIPYVIGGALRREPILLGDGLQVRDYLHVSDVVTALTLAAEHPDAVGQAFNIGAGAGGACRIRDLVEMILRLTGAPASLCRYGEVQHGRGASPSLVADAALAERVLGWRQQVTLEAGLRSTIDCLRGTHASRGNQLPAVAAVA